MTNSKNIALYQLGLGSLKTYLLAAAFVIGNIALPQLCHLVPQGGLILLPIYFFTLIAAYKYGFTVGLLTAVLSPLVNNLLFGMPASGMLPIILVKSTFLALAQAALQDIWLGYPGIFLQIVGGWLILRYVLKD